MGPPPFNSSTELNFISPSALLPINEGVEEPRRQLGLLPFLSFESQLLQNPPFLPESWDSKGRNRVMEKTHRHSHADLSSLLRRAQGICHGKYAQ